MNLKLAAAVILFVCFYGLDDAWGSSDTSSSSSSSDSSSVSLVCDNKHTYFKKKRRCLKKCDVAYGCYSCKRVYDCHGCKWKCVADNAGYCDTLYAPAHGTISTSDHKCGSSVKYGCDDGFKLIGSAIRHCCKNGYWDGNEPKCVAKCEWINLCPPPNGQLERTDSQYGGLLEGAKLSYSCNDDYDLIGPAMRECDEDGNWTGTTPVCQPKVHCSDLCPPYNGDVNMTGTNVGDQAIYSCDQHYELIGQYNRTCQDDGSWSEEEPSCAATGCSLLSPPINGDVSIDGIQVGLPNHFLYINGSSASYNCDNGYAISTPENTIRYCEHNGSLFIWSGIPPTCSPIACGEPGQPLHGSMYYNDYRFEDSAEYTCDEGYILNGDPHHTCLSNGLWSSPLPVCVPVECCILCDPLNGFVNQKGTGVGSNATYTCGDGYELIGTNQRVCSSNGTWSGDIPTCQKAYIKRSQCQDQYIQLECPSPSKVLVHSAFYGRRIPGIEKCPSDDTIECISDELVKVMNTCHGYLGCGFWVTSDFFREDPCPGINKYLEVEYLCD